jgi:hypothetical protein
MHTSRIFDDVLGFKYLVQVFGSKFRSFMIVILEGCLLLHDIDHKLYSVGHIETLPNERYLLSQFHLMRIS